MSRALKALGVAAATVLLASGCAAGTHPGAAAVVGGTEISIGDLTKLTKAVGDATGAPYPTQTALTQMVNNAAAEEIRAQKSITITPAEVAEIAPKIAPDDPKILAKLQADPTANEFLNSLATSTLLAFKLGGVTGLDDPDIRTKQQAGLQTLKEAVSTLNIKVSPRFGQWTSGSLDTSISGSLSDESPQAKAKREADEKATQQQPQG